MSDPSERPTHICAHLVADADDFHVWFTGEARISYWVCADCAQAHPTPPAPLIAFTEAFYAAREPDICWDGTVGMPEVLSRATELRFAHNDFERADVGGWIAVEPRPGGEEWWVLLADRLAIWTPATNTLTTAVDLAGLDFEINAETALAIAPDDSYAAIYEVSGQLARIYDLATGAQTAQIDRGDYRPENSHFPIAFFMADARCLLIAATDWCRLDIHDPASGAVLSTRSEPEDVEDGRTLDYFHGRLAVSPDGRRVVDRGWHWHPLGVVRSWSVAAWLTNPWESEDGPSVHDLAARAYFWDGPACWIDADTVAIWGWGNDDECMVPAALLFDAESGDLRFWFPGPEVRRPGAWPPKKQAPAFFFDTWLFSASDHAGTTVWDVATGERLGEDAELKPIHYHPDARRFITLTETGVRLSRLMDG